jgi:hypothetical protein
MIDEKINEILDKISRYGIESITSNERGFLDSFATEDEEIINTKLLGLMSDYIIEDGYFKFELEDIVYADDGIEYIGKLYVPDLISEDGDIIIEGNLKGKIILENNGDYLLDFFKVVKINGIDVEYDVFEFCDGLEYEFDSFVDYLLQELE